MDRARAVDLVRGLVEIPSLSHHESEAVRWLVCKMGDLGYDRTFIDDAGNAVGEIGTVDADKTMVLLGHIDTVPGNIPVRIESTTEGDLLYGRGSVDAKGPLATFVATGARLGATWARQAGVRVVVVGAVEEEAATSKGARFIAARFDGTRETRPVACVIGEPSHWYRVTLGYKGRLLLDFSARQPMAHSAGPEASVATVVVDLWNWIAADAAKVNRGREKLFDQLTPSLRRILTSTTVEMLDLVEAQIAWRLPLGVDAATLVRDLLSWMARYAGAQMPSVSPGDVINGEPVTLAGPRTAAELHFRGWERAWRSERQNILVRSFLSAIRNSDAAVQPGFVLKTGTSDMNVVAPLWRCPIVAYGPGDSALDHTPNEHLSLDEYWRSIGVMEHMLRRLADGAGP